MIAFTKMRFVLALALAFPVFAKAANADFISVVTDRSDLQYVEGEQAHISVSRKISPTDPNFEITFESYFPDEGHPINLAKIGETSSFITPRLSFGQQHFIVKAYVQILAKPPFRDVDRSLVQTKDIILNVSHDMAPLNLTITSPTGGQVIEELTVTVAGSSNKTLSQVSVHFDNNPPVQGNISGDGLSFSANVTASHNGSLVLYVDGTDFDGNVNEKHVTISSSYNRPPVANLKLTSLSSNTAPAMALFDASGSLDPDGDALRYSYDFGDGTSAQSNLATATHQYMTAGSYTAVVTATDPGGMSSSRSVSVVLTEVILPANPKDVAPPLSAAPNVPAPTMADKFGFIYSGSNPIQTNVDQTAINPDLISVFRGHVGDDSGSDLSGVKVTIAGESAFGQTLTRTDGSFDIAVNAGGNVTIQMEKSGYSNVQRTVTANAQNYYAVPDVVMAALDQKVTTVSLNTQQAQVVHASTVTDKDGERTASLILPSQTTAQIKMPDGSLKPVANLSIRATEITVGDNGPKKMPGPLPPRSAYTYAVDLTSDEALAMGGTGVQFSQPVPFYVDNFLNFPIGAAVPVGYFNPDTHVWEAQKDGIVMKIVDIQNGKAVISLSPGASASADDLAYFNFTDEELTKLALTYSVGKELWRTSTTHFSYIDLNFLGSSAVGPQVPSAVGDVNPDCGCAKAQGSIIDISRRTLGEKIDMVGVDFSIYYSSLNSPGRKAANSVTAHLFDIVPPNLVKVQVDAIIAGQTIHQESTDLASFKDVTINWDGNDAFGRPVPDPYVPITLNYVFYYNSTYLYLPFDRDNDSTWDGYSGQMVTYTASRQSLSYTLTQQTGLYRISSPRSLAGQKNLGGWTLPIYNRFDIASESVVLGDGSVDDLSKKPKFLMTVLGGRSSGFSGDGGLAINARFASIDSYSMQDDGTILVIDAGNSRIRRIDKNGIINTIIGNGAKGYNGDEIPALQAKINMPSSLTQDRSGNIYFVDTNNNRVRKVTADGIIHTIAGTGTAGYSGDKGSAVAAQLNKPKSIHFVGGSVYFADTNNNVIRRIDPTGNILTVAGNGSSGYSGDGGLSIEAQLTDPRISAVTANGEMYISDAGNNVIRKVDNNGVITTIAGNGSQGSDGDSGVAIQASLSGPTNISLLDDGTFYIADKGNNKIRYVDSKGIITTAIGNGTATESPNGYPGTISSISGPNVVEVRPGGKIFFIDSGGIAVRELGPTNYNFDQSTNTYSVVSQDDSEVYFFDLTGTHVRTLTAKTGALVYEFEHDSNGNLIGVKDRSGNETVIAWSGNKISSFQSPYAQTTSLSYNSDGNLSDVISPMGNAYHMEYSSADGLLSSFRKPSGETSAFSYDPTGLLSTDTNALSYIQKLSGTLGDAYYGAVHTSAEGLTKASKYSTNSSSSFASTAYPSGNIESTITNGNASYTIGDYTGTNGHYENLYYSSDQRISGSKYMGSDRIQELGTSETRRRSYPSLQSIFSYVQQDIVTQTSGSSVVAQFDSQAGTLTEQTSGGRTSAIKYDQNENLVQEQTGNFASTNYSWDSRGRVSQIQQADRTTSFIYNSQGQLDQMTDPMGRNFKFGYDQDGRNISQTMPDGRVNSFNYDANSNLVGIKPSGRNLHAFIFSIIDLLSQYVPPLNSGNTVSYSYNKDNSLNQKFRADGRNVNYNIDSLTGLVDSVITSEGTTTYNYQFGQIIGASNISATMQFSWRGHTPFSVAGSTNAYPFLYQENIDNNGRIGSFVINEATLPLGYDVDDLINSVGDLQISRSGDAGVVTGTSLRSTQENITYSSFAEISAHTYSYNGNNIYSEQYTRDKLGRITAKTIQTAAGTSTLSYEYNTAGRLDKVTNGSVVNLYAYDDQGNRISATYGTSASLAGTYDGQDRILTYGNNQYSLSADGEVTSVLDNSNGQTMALSFDSLSELVGVKLKDGRNISYVMNPMNQRYSKSINGTLSAYFSYDLQGRLVSDGDQNGTRNVYVYATQANSPDYIIRGSAVYRLIKDQIGSVLMVVNADSGAIAQQILYDEFGRVLSDSSPGFQLIGFAGGIYDSDTKLMHFGARDYDADTSRWMSKDPIGFGGGDLNLYGYVAVDPINSVDSSGLYSCTYSISTHQMSCAPNNPEHSSYNSSAFVSGRNEGCACQNNPDSTAVSGAGPIPVGDYSIGAPVDNIGRRNLTPINGTDVFHRTAFQIHGCSDPSKCSHGCIGATTNSTRDGLNSILKQEEGHNTLHVVR